MLIYDKKKNPIPALAGVAQWIVCRSSSQRSPVRFPVRAQAWVVGQASPSLGVCLRQPINASLAHPCFSPSVTPFLLLSLKINK